MHAFIASFSINHAKMSRHWLSNDSRVQAPCDTPPLSLLSGPRSLLTSHTKTFTMTYTIHIILIIAKVITQYIWVLKRHTTINVRVHNIGVGKTQTPVLTRSAVNLTHFIHVSVWGTIRQRSIVRLDRHLQVSCLTFIWYQDCDWLEVSCLLLW